MTAASKVLFSLSLRKFFAFSNALIVKDLELSGAIRAGSSPVVRTPKQKESSDSRMDPKIFICARTEKQKTVSVWTYADMVSR